MAEPHKDDTKVLKDRGLRLCISTILVDFARMPYGALGSADAGTAPAGDVSTMAAKSY